MKIKMAKNKIYLTEGQLKHLIKQAIKESTDWVTSNSSDYDDNTKYTYDTTFGVLVGDTFGGAYDTFEKAVKAWKNFHYQGISANLLSIRDTNGNIYNPDGKVTGRWK